MSNLLPNNATKAENALDDTTARVGDVDVKLREVWSPDNSPSELLAWLAWAFSVDTWNTEWTEDQKRDVIRRSIEVHRQKGTIGAIKTALSSLFVNVVVQEWFQFYPIGDPYTFRVWLNVDQEGVPADLLNSIVSMIDRAKNLRSHLDVLRVTVTSKANVYLACAPLIGSEIHCTNYIKSELILNEINIIG
jgi:phage tail P2-like protein